MVSIMPVIILLNFILRAVGHRSRVIKLFKGFIIMLEFTRDLVIRA